MWTHRYLSRIDFKILLIIIFLMFTSLAIISSMSSGYEEGIFFTSLTIKQIQHFCIGWGLFFFFAGFDYHKLREWTWIFYIVSLFLLIGLYLASPIQNVQRWFRIPIIGLSFQPSEMAKLAVLLTLAWFLEKRSETSNTLATAWGVFCIVGIPFLLILKQPALGTAIVLIPITLCMGYLGGMHEKLLKYCVVFFSLFFLLLSSIFLGLLPHSQMKPVMLKFLKPYQYERLNPDTYHQRASQVAISLGGGFGEGWKKSEFSKRKYLPAATTDSVFPAFC